MTAALLCAPPALATGNDCGGRTSLLLVNGKIHTMDARNRVVSTVLIENGEFAAVGSLTGSLQAALPAEQGLE